MTADLPPDQVRSVAFIRNVMVGRNGLTRQVLLNAFTDAGATNPRSYLATGNITFTAPHPEDARLRTHIEDAVEAVLGRHETVYIRTLAELSDIVGRDPFASFADEEVHERCVSFLPSSTTWTTTLPLTSTREDVTIFAVDELEAYSVTRLIKGRPGTAGPMLEREIGGPVTTRNWNTVTRIVDRETARG